MKFRVEKGSGPSKGISFRVACLTSFLQRVSFRAGFKAKYQIADFSWHIKSILSRRRIKKLSCFPNKLAKPLDKAFTIIKAGHLVNYWLVYRKKDSQHE